MPAQISTGFSVIDTYNIIREDMQLGGAADYEDEELDALNQQQEVPQFSFAPSPSPSSSSSSSPSSFHTAQQVVPPTYHPPSPAPSHSPSPSPAPTPSPAYSPYHSPYHCPSPAATTANHQSQPNSFLEMDVGASFLEELMGQHHPNHHSPLPPTATTPTPLSHTTTTTTTFVAEAATSGCTVLQAAEITSDQQLMDTMDVGDFYDLDKHSFYDDSSSSLDLKVKDNAGTRGRFAPGDDWAAAELGITPVGPSLTELGPVGSNEQDDLLTAFDTIRWDIMQDCKQLGISPDPKAWTARNTQLWVKHTLDKFQKTDDCSTSLALPGDLLCQEREQLVWASPKSGDLLRQQLELWIVMAADLPSPATTTTTAATTTPNKPQQQSFLVTSTTPTSDHLLLSSNQSTPTTTTAPRGSSHRTHPAGSVSPAPSNDSVSSSQSSSSSSLLPSEAEIFWCPAESSEDELFQDSSANLTAPHQPRSTASRKSTSSTSSSSSSTTTTKQHAGGRPGKQIRLWEFLKELLEDNDPSMKWLDRVRGIFKIQDSTRVARLWGERKNHPAMNYDKLSRSVRQYYKKGIIKKTVQTRRLVYQFCERYL